jgi:hypothetical protein
MKVKLFTKKECPRCPPAKELVAELEKEGITVEYHDTDEVDGMVEASLHQVMATPTTVVVDDQDQEKESWRGDTPDKEKIRAYFK